MIGVIARSEEIAIAREFFELFKTPWEVFRPGGTYDVVLATTDEIPEVHAPLLVAYGARRKNIDSRISGSTRLAGPHHWVGCGDERVPLYGDLLMFENCGVDESCLLASSGIAGVRVAASGSVLLRIGYDLFAEVGALLTKGQPIENARTPTLDLHIALLRDWILTAGIPVLEIPPIPAGYSFSVCLTHDIDFIGIRQHKFDHTLLGFLYRSSVPATRNFLRGRLAFRKLLKIWGAVASLPFVFLGWARDFWEPFEWYLRIEENLPATYFLIPFKRRAGECVPGTGASRRATAYDVTDIVDQASVLQSRGCEVGVHGIDAWHSAERGRLEKERIQTVSKEAQVGIRMHWLLQDENTAQVLENAGYTYDASAGYNETVGYRNGTAQVFLPLKSKTLLELPLHIQDGALFYPQRLDLGESEAWNRCGELIENARKSGGVVTLLWHDRSHGPERYWGEFYVKVVEHLKNLQPWFATARQAVEWFRKRREIRFERVVDEDGNIHNRVKSLGDTIVPPMIIRRHYPEAKPRLGSCQGASIWNCVDLIWDGAQAQELPESLHRAPGPVSRRG